MIGTVPATWRIVYKRAIAGNRLYGVKQREYLQFLDDIKNLQSDYVAVLECKEFEGSPWTFVAYLIVNDTICKSLVLIDEKGEKFIRTNIIARHLKDFLKEKPTFHNLKNLL